MRVIDAHLHLAGARSMNPMEWVVESPELSTARATADLRRLLAAGFTSVRDCGSVGGVALSTAVGESEVIS
jgi:imidazolonepropionase-like amidohydrolase